MIVQSFGKVLPQSCLESLQFLVNFVRTEYGSTDKLVLVILKRRSVLEYAQNCRCATDLFVSENLKRGFQDLVDTLSVGPSLSDISPN